jgi:hypothetical protein
MRMIYALFIVCFGVMLAAAYPHTKTNDLTEMGLKGKVKTLTRVVYETSASGQEPYAFSTITYQFNERGFITSIEEDNEVTIISYDAQDARLVEATYKKDELIRKKTYQKSSLEIMERKGLDRVTFRSSFKYEYDKAGNKTKETHYADGHRSVTHAFEYDDKGNLVQLLGYTMTMKLSFKNTFKYDSQKRKIQLSIYDSESDVVIAVEKYAYNTEGFLTMTRAYGERGRLAYTKQYTYQIDYDEQGNWLKKVTFVNDVQNDLFATQTLSYY